MISAHIAKIEKRMKSKGEWFQHSSSSEEVVDGYLSANGLQCPEQFRQFLIEYGFLGWFGEIIMGIPDDTLEPDFRVEFDLASYTEEMRGYFPKLKIGAALMSDGRGGFYYFKGAEDGAFHYEHETNRSERAFVDFEALLKHHAR
jgi:hypothetical protein